MSETITGNRALRLFGAYMNNVDLTGVDDEFVNWVIHHPKEAGKQMSFFLRNCGKDTVSGSCVAQIDRFQKFNPTEFISDDWWIEEEDERSLSLTEIDLAKIRLETCLKSTESHLSGEEKLKRLKSAGHIRLDAGVFLTLWHNQVLIPPVWKRETNDCTTLIYFDGTVFKRSNGRRYVLYLYWSPEKGWCWDSYWLFSDQFAYCPSAVLAS